MRFKILLLSFFFSQLAFSQQCFPERGKEYRVYKKVRNLIKKDKINDANNHLKLVLDEYAVFDALRAEIAWLKSEDIKAEKFAKEALYLCDSLPNIYYLLGEIEYRRKNFIDAAEYLKKSIDYKVEDPYLTNAQKYYEKANTIADIIKNPVPFVPVVMDGISTMHDEYLPMISADQKSFFYTRRYLKEGLDVFWASYEEKFTFSTLHEGSFNNGESMPDPFNRSSNEGGASLTIDNQILYYTKCYEVGGGGKNCDLAYVMKGKDDKWEEILTFNKKINGEDSWESQPSVSKDGNSIIFASNRPGGFGGLDLYIIHKKSNGKWTDPKNLGGVINSKEHEKSPFLHVDDETLFFASKRFPSLGGFDIFLSRKDSLGNWQDPVNIGYPINTSSDEISLSVSTDGELAFFASNELKGLRGWDIYQFPLYTEAKPKKVLFLQGFLNDTKGNSMKDAKLEIKNIRTSETTSIKIKDGSYTAAITLDQDDDFLLRVKKEGYAFHSKYISSSEKKFLSPLSLDFMIDSLKNGQSYRLNNVYFSTKSSEIKHISSQVLISFADYLLENQNFDVLICGHTDNIGTKGDNLDLSHARALEVYNFLIKNGIASSRLSYKGFGESDPVTSNTTDLGRAKNRRTEFVIFMK